MVNTLFTPCSGGAPADAAGGETGADPHLSILAYNHRLSRRKMATLSAALPAAPELKFW